MRVRNAGDTADAKLIAGDLRVTGGAPAFGKYWRCDDNTGEGSWADLPGTSIVYPRRATLWGDEGTGFISSVQLTISPTQVYGYYAFNSNAMAGDGITWGLLLEAGTYDLSALGVTSTGLGIVTWQLNGSPVITNQDWYSSTQINNQVKSAQITVPSSGYHTLRALVTSKNNASSNYFYAITKVWLKQASD